MTGALSVAIAPPFSPLCMDADELTAWAAMRDRSTSGNDRAAIPCTDCLLFFAIEMRAVGACNGTPMGVEEDEDMDLPQSYAATNTPPRRMASAVEIELSAPPCASCAHESVCALRMAVDGIVTVEAVPPKLPDGLRLALVATVECDHFLRDRTKPAPVRVLTSQERGQANGAAKYRASSTADWTPERRAAQGERMRARLAKEKAEREAASA